MDSGHRIRRRQDTPGKETIKRVEKRGKKGWGTEMGS
jgi:hypothetical protein